jgi:hypothetical protein
MIYPPLPASLDPPHPAILINIHVSMSEIDDPCPYAFGERATQAFTVNDDWVRRAVPGKFLPDSGGV